MHLVKWPVESPNDWALHAPYHVEFCMFPLVQNLTTTSLTHWANQWVLNAALDYFMTFLLVVVRLSGLMVIGPFFGHTSIPTRVKILIAFSLALMVTPVLPEIRDRGFQALDVNQDGILSGEETPRVMQEAARAGTVSAAALQTTGVDSDEALSLVVTSQQYRQMVSIPSTLFDLLWVTATELLIGMMLGLGVVIILSGLQLAGETFDQQAGTALSEIFNPALGSSSSPTGQLLFLLGTTALLVMPPFDGHLMMLMSLLKTFEILPVGMAWIDVTTLDLLRHLMSQSLVIAIQIVAPLLAAMALLSVALGFLGYTVPQINVLVLGFPIRAMLSALILVVTLSGASQLLIDWFPQVLEELTHSLISTGQ